MLTYQLMNIDGIKRIVDNTISFIPNDLRNRDWQTYQDWCAEGNTPDLAD